MLGGDLNAAPDTEVLDALLEPFEVVETGATCTPVVLDDHIADYLLVAGAIRVLGSQDFETDNSDHRLLYVDVVPSPAGDVPE